jgi:hypothetical protein
MLKKLMEYNIGMQPNSFGCGADGASGDYHNKHGGRDEYQ